MPRSCPALRTVVVAVAVLGAAGTAEARWSVHGSAVTDAMWSVHGSAESNAVYWTTAVGVGPASDVYVGLQAGTSGKVARVGGHGTRLGAWPTDGPMKDLAVGVDGTVYTVMDRSGRVYRFGPDGAADGMWQAGYFPSRIASGPLGESGGGSVYVLWTPQSIGQPPSGPPRVTRYSSRGETLAEWEVTAHASDLAVVVGDADAEGVVHVADAGGAIARYAPDGTPVGEWRAVASGRIAAAPGGLVYVASPGALQRYTGTGDPGLRCDLPPGEPRDVAVDPGDGDIYVLYPDTVLRLAPDCAVRARFAPDAAPGASGPPIYLPAALNDGRFPEAPVATPTAPPTSSPLPTRPQDTPELPTPTATPGAALPAFVVAVGSVSEPDVAGDAARTDCRHLVVWLDEAGGGAVRARFVRPDGMGEPFAVSAEAGANGPPALAYGAGAGRWLAVWAAPDEHGGSAVRGRAIGCSGPDGAVVEIGDDMPIEDQPAVAADGDGFAVVWRRSFSGRPDRQLVGARVAGAAASEPRALGEPGEVSDPAVDCEGAGSCLVAWAEGPPGRQNILARAWTPRTGAIVPDVLQVALDGQDYAPSVAWNATPGVEAYAIAWSVEWRYRAVYARSLRAGALGPEIEVDMSLGGSFAPDVSALGRGFVTAYARSGPSPEYDEHIKLARLSLVPDTGALARVDESYILSGNAPWVPAVAGLPDEQALAVWRDRPSPGYGQIVGRYAGLPLPTPEWP